MRMSCNGCRVLRKGCSEDCSIKPCLQWIKSSESQANATVFLAKFYGRAGLMNLINAGPDHLRPAVFRSLLYEACGRIVNPIYGSVGLLWSGNWQLCQDAVEAVLKGEPIAQIATEAAETHDGPPLKAYDIRHVSKNEKADGLGEIHRVRNRCRFKRSKAKGSGGNGNGKVVCVDEEEENRSTSHGSSSLSHQSALNAEGESRDVESLDYNRAAEARADLGEIELELTLGLESGSKAAAAKPKQAKRSRDERACLMELGLDYSA